MTSQGRLCRPTIETGIAEVGWVGWIAEESWIGRPAERPRWYTGKDVSFEHAEGTVVARDQVAPTAPTRWFEFGTMRRRCRLRLVAARLKWNQYRKNTVGRQRDL